MIVRIYDLRAHTRGHNSIVCCRPTCADPEPFVPVNCLSFSVDSNSFAAVIADGKVMAWDMRTSTVQTVVRKGTSNKNKVETWTTVQYDNTGTYLAAGGPSIHVFSVPNAYSLIDTLCGHSVTGLRWGAGRHADLISCSQSSTVEMWSAGRKM